MKKCNSKITMDDKQVFSLQCNKDRFIMNVIDHLSPAGKEYIQKCRKHLKVDLFSDIYNTKGDTSEQGIYHRKVVCKSKERWPGQGVSSKQTWRVWKRFLDEYGKHAITKV